MGIRQFFCNHQWEIVHKDTVRVFDSDTPGDNPVEFKYVIIQRCPKCGKFRKTMFRY